MKSIGDKAFNNCVELVSIILPNRLRKIGNQAFMNCRNLTELHIPKSVVEIGEDAIARCGNKKTPLKVVFHGKTPDNIRVMANFPFGATNKRSFFIEK